MFRRGLFLLVLLVASCRVEQRERSDAPTPPSSSAAPAASGVPAWGNAPLSPAPAPPNNAPPTPPPDGSRQLPYVVDRFPFVQDEDSSKSSSRDIDHYSAAPQLWEEGPELYYRLTINTAGTLKAELAEAPGVDVDLHLLRSLAQNGGLATDAIARADKFLEQPLAAGDYWLVVDSYGQGSAIQAGAFTLAIELDIPDVWQDIQLAAGLRWRKKIYTNYGGGRQTTSVLEVDLAAGGLEFKPRWTGAGIKTSESAAEPKALCAINGGFFAAGPRSLSLIKIDDVLRATNQLGGPRRGLGIDRNGRILFESVADGADWPLVRQGISGHPNLVTAGRSDVWPNASTSFYTSRHPRTALGLTAARKLLLVTVDGRTAAGAGLSIDDLAQYLIQLGAIESINLDGGGSTTMWVRGMSINGIVNHPSDNGRPDHHGERTVSDAVVIYRN